MNLSARLLFPRLSLRRVPTTVEEPLSVLARVGPGWTGLAGRPGAEIWLYALVAMLLSCYPVVFLKGSFTSPYFGQPLLHRVPLNSPPGLQPETLAGSDIGAMFWAHMPYSVVESRAFRAGEFPLWNRYNSGGVTLLGQGQSMLGDPLHVIVLLGGGESWAWDIKFLLAKLLFAAGVGYAVRAATGHRPASLILTVSSAFLGFFSFRLNHAAFFSLCYAPWILAAWLQIARAATSRAAAGWTAALLLANWSELNSGTVKEAYMLLGGLNLCGLFAFALRREEVNGLRRPKLLHLAIAGTGFVLLAAPVLGTFFGALRAAHTSYDIPRAWQLQPSVLVGFFDDIFYRQYNRQEMILDPAANFLVLLGGLYFLVHLRRLLRDPFCWALSVGALVPLCLVFGVVSPRLITALPFLGNIIHIDNTFSCVLLVLAFPLAGFGIRAAWTPLGAPGRHWRGDWGFVALGLAVLLGMYFGGTQAAQRSSFPVIPPGQPLPKSAFFWGYALSLTVAALALPPAVRLLRRGERRAAWAGGILAVLCLFLIHWRMGMHEQTPFDFYVVNPPPRGDLLVRSPAVELIKARQAVEPGRVAGFDGNLFSGFNAAVGLEGINGPDALMNPRYRDLVEAAGLHTFWDWGVEARRETLPQLGRVYDFFNVRHFLGTAGDVRPTPGLLAVAEGDLRVFANPTAWPRAFFTDRLARYDGTAKNFVELIHSGDGRPFAAADATTLAAHPALHRIAEDLPARVCVAARDYRLLSNTTTFRVAAPGPGLVVLGEAWVNDDFRVTVNGAPQTVIRVNHLFKAVTVDGPGDIEVTFHYWPRHLTASLWAAAAGAVLLLAWGRWAGLARGLRRVGLTASPVAA